MMLKDIPEIKLPQFKGGSYAGLDRLYLPHNMLILSKVKQLESGDLELTAGAKDGHEQFKGRLRFKVDDEGKKKFLYEWLSARIGKTIDSIYRSEFSFEKDGE